VVFDAEGACLVAHASTPLQLISRPDGSREQLAEWWVTALKSALNQLDPALRKTVSSIGVSGQQHGFVPVAASGEVLAPVKLWCDTSTVAECVQINEHLGGEEHCIALCGNPVRPGYTASKVLWLKSHHPDIYRQIDCVLLPHDYINFYLTGEKVMERGDASGTGFLDVRSGRWCSEVLAAVDDERDLMLSLPRLAEPDQFIGRLTTSVAAELGLPAGVPVSCGGGDNMMAAIGTGSVSPGRMTMSLGTSGTLFAYADQPIIDPEGTLAAFCDSTGGWLPLLCTMNCTVATELTRQMLALPLEEVEKSVSRIPVGANGVLTLPFFQGERTPNLPAAQGCVFGLNQHNYTAENLLRSAMESTIFGLRLGLDAFTRQGCKIESLRVTGGGSKSAVWRQMVADIFQMPVSVQQVDEGAALGAAIQACWVHSKGSSQTLRQLTDTCLPVDPCRSCEPLAGNAAAYTEHYENYLRHIDAITPLYSSRG